MEDMIGAIVTPPLPLTEVTSFRDPRLTSEHLQYEENVSHCAGTARTRQGRNGINLARMARTIVHFKGNSYQIGRVFFIDKSIQKLEVRATHDKDLILTLTMSKLMNKRLETLFMCSTLTLQGPKKWLVCGLVNFATAVARLVCPDLLG